MSNQHQSNDRNNPNYKKNSLNQYTPSKSMNPLIRKKSSNNSISQKLDDLNFITRNNSKHQNKININGPLKGEKDHEKQLLYYFKDKRIYIEIFNGNINSSSTFYNILLKYKIIQCKKLSKKIDYIVFKDGHLKTKKYAVVNNIKMVNPLWIDDKVNNHIFKEDIEYEIKTNFGDIVIREKYEKNKIKEESNKKKEEQIKSKNYEHELEVEYDTEYANMIDKMRATISQKNENSGINNIQIINENEDENLLNVDLDTGIKRKKRKSINAIENKITDDESSNNNINIHDKIFKNTNDITKRHSTKENNSKENHNKKGKKYHNKKNNSENNASRNSNKQKKIEINENNYILELSQNNDKVLTMAKKEDLEIKKDNEKINIITYHLDQKEIQCLKTLTNFEYKGNLNFNNKNDNNKKIYDSSNVIILDKDRLQYDWKIYEFLLDKKILVDFTLFLFEFINGESAFNNSNDKLIDKVNEISINNECYFFNRKIRLQKRSMIQSMNIVDNIISKEKGEQINTQINENENIFYFLLNQDIPEDEKKILLKLLKNYLKANIININIPKKRAKSVTSQININLKKIEKKSKKNIKLEVIKENKDVNNDENKNNENIKENTNEEPKIEGTFLISKEKVNRINFLKKVKYYKGVISYKYVYDSFLNGQLLDLNDKNIFEKYQL